MDHCLLMSDTISIYNENDLPRMEIEGKCSATKASRSRQLFSLHLINLNVKSSFGKIEKKVFYLGSLNWLLRKYCVTIEERCLYEEVGGGYCKRFYNRNQSTEDIDGGQV
ncbi:hypothetical protein OUZ56_013768 [Daphnia magna]|uniref:Uncharacterized protein n=1 Tax=Daphnia magna TaxID=35525 RepID=A0ABQ9Z7L7_9CRUS|nr:hypothetical protein OUZ56_013768 [Daphnia magna]